MKEYAIYTAVVGQYDLLLQPKSIHEEFDYILFSDSIIEKNIGVWQVREIPYTNCDNTRIARWVKTHPEELLDNYNFSIWMDANIQIASPDFYDRIFNHIKAKTLVASMWHNKRDCIYDEAMVVVYRELESEKIIVNWIKFLLKEKYPPHNGLFETNVLFRNHKSPLIDELDHLWWSCIEYYSRRDQLSFNYVLWKTGIHCPYFFSSHENARNTTCLMHYSHTNSKTRKSPIYDFHFIKYYKRVYHEFEAIKLKRQYFRIAHSPFPILSIFLLGQFYRVKARLMHSKQRIRKKVICL